jgi:hypothetical protein
LAEHVARTRVITVSAVIVFLSWMTYYETQTKRFLGDIRIGTTALTWEPGSSGSIVTTYGLYDRAIEVRSPAEARDFSCKLCVQTGCGDHAASCTMGAGGPFPAGKARLRRDADHSPPSSAEVVNE